MYVDLFFLFANEENVTVYNQVLNKSSRVLTLSLKNFTKFHLLSWWFNDRSNWKQNKICADNTKKTKYNTILSNLAIFQFSMDNIYNNFIKKFN